MSEFTFFQKNNDSKNLVLFIHGFTGDIKTWIHSNGSKFPDLILKNDYVRKNFDVAAYEYFSLLFDVYAKKQNAFKIMKSLWRRRTQTKKKNIDISELSNNLKTHIRFELSQYENIFIVAHSMGGLIAKDLIVNNIMETGQTNIRLFISLAVPHLGSETATLGSLISSNLQIDNLRPLSDCIGNLNQQWIKLPNKPIVKYIYGSYDKHVPKTSAVSIEIEDKDVCSFPEDHNSISKPKDESNTLVKAICIFLEETYQDTRLKSSGYLTLNDSEAYQDELFVLKLFLADIDPSIRENAQELFLNAEFSRKLLKSKDDRAKLSELFENIQQLYRDSYDKYLGQEPENSNLLLAEVHEKITSEDSRLLQTIIPSLKLYHKKGMLHQLANDEFSNIWWSRERDVSTNDQTK